MTLIHFCRYQLTDVALQTDLANCCQLNILALQAYVKIKEDLTIFNNQIIIVCFEESHLRAFQPNK